MLRLIKIVPRVNARKYGKQWIVNRDAMLREYGNPVCQSYKYSTSNTVHFSGQYFLYVYVDWYFYKAWSFSRHREMGVSMEKKSSDSPVCPKCNSTNVAF